MIVQVVPGAGAPRSRAGRVNESPSPNEEPSQPAPRRRLNVRPRGSRPAPSGEVASSTVVQTPAIAPPSSPDLLAAQPSKKWQPEDLLHSRAAYALALVIAVLLLAFSSGERRTDAADYVEHDLKEPVEAISPFSIIDVFFDSARGCSFDSFSCEPKSIWVMLPHFPKAFIDTANHVIDQGIVGIVVIGLPFLFMAAGVISSIKEDDSWLIMLHPGYWAAFLLFVALGGWVIQFVLLIMLFVVKQTILACGILTLVYVVYEKWELGGKIANLVAGAMGKRVEPVV